MRLALIFISCFGIMERAGAGDSDPSPALATTANWVGVEHAMTDINHSTAPVYYKAHPEFLSYRFGTDGSIWSTRFQGGYVRRVATRWRRLRPAKMKRGHVRAHLAGEGLSHNRVLLHRLILETFVGPCPPGMEGCHYDGNPANNRLENLRWDTRKGNREDDRRNGTLPMGMLSPIAKLSDSDIPVIRDLVASGVSNSVIGRRFGVHGMTIHAIRTGRTWKHI